MEYYSVKKKKEWRTNMGYDTNETLKTLNESSQSQKTTHFMILLIKTARTSKSGGTEFTLVAAPGWSVVGKMVSG